MALAMQSRTALPARRVAISALQRSRMLTTRVAASGRSSQRPEVSAPEASLARRELLIATAATATLPALSALPAAAADAGAFNESKSGLKWKDVEEGTGPSPVKGATIRAHYTGRLTNGTVFDSSYPRRNPLSFQDIPAMKEGGKRQLIIPPELGYGARGAGGVIPPNAVLEFDVELLPRK
ncbi:hypothetical protein GPECTOR_516g493 [Gonium pectorale]|uniref:peptidylprolyl isomerase n=1 Tax=Gonium pectorale TaxID=33097 RepID=A0A150FUR8_GONPE|nr:hypothetical protein GPECTOR_516g493 [Gonium pectorale]|eukprot:KXZ41371.1 hypothetical protein GPECTOR_516g493 [Gonium pectorale]